MQQEDKYQTETQSMDQSNVSNGVQYFSSHELAHICGHTVLLLLLCFQCLWIELNRVLATVEGLLSRCLCLRCYIVLQTHEVPVEKEVQRVYFRHRKTSEKKKMSNYIEVIYDINNFFNGSIFNPYLVFLSLKESR